MNNVHQMIQTHPVTATYGTMNALVSCIEECYSCAQSCTTCADACLNEPDVDSLRRCIRLNLDCADVCATTGRMLSRQTEPDTGMLRRMVEVCAIACRACGDECQKHAQHHEHCRVCAEACRQCEQACMHLMQAMH